MKELGCRFEVAWLLHDARVGVELIARYMVFSQLRRAAMRLNPDRLCDVVLGVHCNSM